MGMGKKYLESSWSAINYSAAVHGAIRRGCHERLSVEHTLVRDSITGVVKPQRAFSLSDPMSIIVSKVIVLS